MFVDNQINFGYLVTNEEFVNLSKDLINLELYDYPNNKNV